MLPGMRLVIDSDLAAYVAAVRPWLSTDPVRNNVIMTVLQSRLDGVEPIEDGILLGRLVNGDGELAGVAVRTPPHPMLVSAMQPAARDALAAYLIERAPEVTELNGTVETAQPIAQAIATARGGSVEESLGLGRFQLRQVIPPAPVSGQPRPATIADLDLVLGWVAGFHEDTGGHGPAGSEQKIRSRIELGQFWLWEDGGEPVGMANQSDPAGGVARINLVFTPSALRGRGYASALVAFLSQRILDAGYTPSLYTDLANPTSNKIYQAIGFEKLDEASIWTVTEPGVSSGT
jgi:predicted GNAT family acetyltransferase